MDEVSLHRARDTIGEIVDRARLSGTPTMITRQGKAAAVVVSVPWYEDALSRIAPPPAEPARDAP